MSCIIAISGKGGVGKTTISALFIKELVRMKKTPVLAIDADPNSCLDNLLGVEVKSSIGSARESVKEEAQNAAISKQELLKLKIAEGLVEQNGYDLISMGRPEGAGCYCYANNVLKGAIQELAGAYPYVVLDNEAGLENLSRRIVTEVDSLLLVSDASNAGLKTLMRLYDLAKEMNVSYKKLYVVINRVRKDGDVKLVEDIKNYTNANEVMLLPYDEEIAMCAENGDNIFTVKEDNVVCKKIAELINKII